MISDLGRTPQVSTMSQMKTSLVTSASVESTPVPINHNFSGMTEDGLVRMFFEEHENVSLSASMMIDHAIRAGDILLELKSRIAFGKWVEWSSEKFDCTRTTIGTYMRIARHKEMIIGARIPTITGAKRFLTEMKADHEPRSRPILIAEAKRLRIEGYTYKEVGHEVGVGGPTVYGWLHPEKRAETRRKQSAKLSLQTKKNRRDRERKERDDLAKRSSDNLGKSYSLVRKCLESLSLQSPIELNREARDLIATAITRLYAAEDAIVSACKLSDTKILER